MKPIFRYFLLVFFSILTACGTFEVGIDCTPTPDVGATATLLALQDQNVQLVGRATQISSLLQSDATTMPKESWAKTDVYGTINFWLSRSIPDQKIRPTRLM